MASIKLKHSGGNGTIIAAPTSNPASDKTLTLPSDVDGTVVSKDSSNSLQNIAGVNGGQLGNRNLIINGAMNVAQRGTSSTVYGYGSVDRWKNTQSGVTVTPTHSQQAATSSDTGIWEAGFRHYLRYALPSAGTNSGASWISFTQFIEAQDIASSGWHYNSTSSYITVSYWIRVSTNQTFYAYVGTRDGTRKRFAYAITASGNNTWTKITKTISGHADLQFDSNTDRGLDIGVTAHYGTDYTGTATLDAWVDNSGTNAYPDFATTWLTAGASTFDLTGVQVEVGDHATDFEHRSYGQELALCQRYYYVTDPTADNFCGGGGLFMFDAGETSVSYGSLTFAQTMRAAPTVVLRDNNGNKDGKVTQHGIAHNIAATATNINENGFSRINRGSGNWGTSAGNPIICGCTADAEI